MSRSLKNISIVSIATVMSRFLGLTRDILVTAVFGASGLASAFVTAFTLPNLFRRLLGEGALTAALVPTLNEELAADRKSSAFRIVNEVTSWLGLVTLVIVVGAMGIFQLLADSAWLREVSHDPAQWQRWRTASLLAVFLFPYLLFICLAAAYSAALQTLGRFVAPALSPILLNLSMIGALSWAVWGLDLTIGEQRMHWLCAGVVFGGFWQMVVPAIALSRAGWRPGWGFTLSPAVRSILILMGPTVLGSAIYLINLSVSRMIGLSLNESAAAILNLATRLVELPIGVFAIAVTTVVFPLISQHAAKADWPRMATAYRKGMRLILAVNMPAAVGMVLLAPPIIRVLFQRGQFGADETAEMIPVLGIFAVGLPFFAYTSLLLRAFYAQKDTRTPVRAAFLSFVVNIVLCFALKGPLSTQGLALASNIAVVVQVWFLQRALTAKRPELAFTPLARDVGKILGASVLMGSVVAAGGWALSALDTGLVEDLVRLVVLIPLGAVVFGGAAFAFRLEGRQDLVQILRRRFKSGEKTTAE